MLAYVFWHRPRDTADVVTYEADLRSFHDALDLPSAPFRLEQLPFGTAGGYEDWYLVEDWSALGALNEAAVDARRRLSHDRVAERAADGWGGIYELLRGEARTVRNPNAHLAGHAGACHVDALAAEGHALDDQAPALALSLGE